MTLYGKDAQEAWDKKQARNKIIKRTLLVVLLFAIGYGSLIYYTG